MHTKPHNAIALSRFNEAANLTATIFYLERVHRDKPGASIMIQFLTKCRDDLVALGLSEINRSFPQDAVSPPK